MAGLDPAFRHLPVAHRALHDAGLGRPENSLAAVRAAVAAGYAIEVDLQPSADGVPMVFHDYDLRRMTGAGGRVRAHRAAELSALSLLGTDEGIPTLDQLLEAVAGKVPLLIELKDQEGAMAPSDGLLERRSAEILSRYRGPLAVMSFSPAAIAAFRPGAPDVAVGLTTSAYTAADWPLIPAKTRERLRDIPDYEPLGCSFVSHEAIDLGSPRIAALKAAGAAILCWTIRSPEEEAGARAVADNITFEGYRPVVSA